MRTRAVRRVVLVRWDVATLSADGKILVTERQLVVVQTLHTRWTKKSRGQPFAASRNATPEVLDIEMSAPPNEQASPVVWHDVLFDESCQFAPRETYRVRQTLDGNFHWNDVATDSDGVRVGLMGRPCFLVAPGETAAVLYNWVAIQ